jgi:hypothetical protein
MTTSNIKPILFGTPMVQAILNGRKSQSRRIVDKQPGFRVSEIIKPGNKEFFHPNEPDGWKSSKVWKFREHWKGNGGVKVLTVNPKYQIGDILWVRETFYKQDIEAFPFVYKADFTEEMLSKLKKYQKWKPSIFMPREAARIFLKVIGVRVEHLQDISAQDCLSEGVGEKFRSGAKSFHSSGIDYQSYEMKQKQFFKELWQSINGKESWDKNPFVWVYEFERTEKPENF